MKRAAINWLRRLLHAAGFEILHRADDPVLRSLLVARETLRVGRDLPAWQSDHLLAQIAAKSHLRNLLRGYQINLVIDVGANDGQFARGLRELGYGGRIVSFEPQAARCRSLRQAAARDPAWQIHELALGNVTTELTLTVYRDNSLSSLHAVNEAGQDRFPDYFQVDHTERVAVRRLDDLAAELRFMEPSARILFKTDTQGHDLAVFEGGATVLARTQVVMSEGSVKPLYHDTPGYQDIVRFLADTGFSLSGIFPLSHSDLDFSLIEVDCCFVRPPRLLPSGCPPSPGV